MIKKWVAHEAAHDWPVLLGWASAVSVVVVALSRLVQAYAIDAHAVIAIGVVGLVAAVALACLAGLIWASWGIRRTEQDAAPFFVALGISLAAIGVCTEAFAGVTTLLWRYGVLSTGGEPGLWRTEEYYLWHLVDSVPLLDIQEGFQWPEPLVFSGVGGGGLLLAYKIFLIAPLLRITIGTYQGLTKWFLEREAKEADLVRRNVLIPRWRPLRLERARTPRRFTDVLRLLVLPLMPAVPVLLGLLLMPLVFEPGSGLDAVVSGWLGDGTSRSCAPLHSGLPRACCARPAARPRGPGADHRRRLRVAHRRRAPRTRHPGHAALGRPAAVSGVIRTDSNVDRLP